ncbi:MAG TPA: site-2 protease family protein [Anaerolineae bacterium]|nr:site-2 protease family protein [Anaerolineae bacterium]
MSEEMLTPQQAADQIEAALLDLFDAQNATLGLPELREAVILRGRLRRPAEEALPEIERRLATLGYRAVLGTLPRSEQALVLAAPRLPTREQAGQKILRARAGSQSGAEARTVVRAEQEPVFEADPADALQAALALEQVKDAVADLFAIRDARRDIPGQPQVIHLRGQLTLPSEKAYPQISGRLRELGYTASLYRDAESKMDDLIIAPGLMPQVERSNLKIHAFLFAATVFTTLYAGAGMSEARPPDDLWWPLFHFWQGWPFALSLLAILLAHELGHYFTGRHYRVPVSLPYFIPLPIPDFLGNVLGTLGAVITMKARMTDRRAMLDIGAAGPIVGLIVAIPILVLGLLLSEVQPIAEGQAYVKVNSLLSLPYLISPNPVYLLEGNSLLYLLLKYAVFGLWLPGNGLDVFIHPVAFAGWAGLLVTSLNLIPAGQLDGGHVLYSLLGNRAQRFTWPIIIVLVALGTLVWPGWFVWAGLVFLFGRRHPGPLDNVTPLDARRKIVAVAVLLVFVLTFSPAPLTVVIPEGTQGDLVRQMVLLAGVWTGFGWLARRAGHRG